MTAPAPRCPARVKTVVSALQRHMARVAPLVADMATHEAAHAVHDALADVNERHRRIDVALGVLRKADEANDLLACGDLLQELAGLHEGLAVAAAAVAARFAELTDEMRRHIMAKLGIEEPEPTPADFEETTWMVASGPKIVATWKKVPGAKRRGRK